MRFYKLNPVMKSGTEVDFIQPENCNLLFFDNGTFAEIENKKLKKNPHYEEIEALPKAEIVSLIEQQVAGDIDAMDERQLSVYEKYTIPTRDEYRSNAFKKVDDLHSEIMKKFTRNATTEERDTWPSKVAAAQFITGNNDEQIAAAVALVANDDMTGLEDLAAIINDVGESPEDLKAISVRILQNSKAFKRSIGVAAKIQRETKEAIMVATGEDVQIENIGNLIKTIEENMNEKANLVVEIWQNNAQDN